VPRVRVPAVLQRDLPLAGQVDSSHQEALRKVVHLKVVLRQVFNAPKAEPAALQPGSNVLPALAVELRALAALAQDCLCRWSL
jgi:hypothetical protein